MQKLKIYITLILFCITNQAFTQTAKLFSVEKELSSSLVIDVFQDHYGQIWMATGDGLNKYDASNFTIYKKNQTQKGSIKNNFSRILYQDQHNNLYIGLGNGLQQYDFYTDTFKDISLISEEGDTLLPYVTSITELTDGKIIIGTSGYGVFNLSRKNDSLYASQANDFIPGLFIEALFVDQSGNLWVTTQKKGLLCRTTENELLKYFPIDEGSNITVNCFTEDKNGDLYIGSTNHGIFKYDRTQKQFSSLPHKTGANLHVNTMYSSQNGDILVGTEGEGLKIFDPKSNKMTHGNFNFSTFDFSKSKITSILEDKDGNMWLGVSQKGVVMLPATSNNFQYIGHKSIKNNNIGSSNITSLYHDQNNSLWVGTDGEGIYLLDQNGRKKAHYSNSKNEKNMPSTIMVMFEDSENNFWLGSYDKGLFKLNLKTGKCKAMNEILDPASTRINPIFGITEDDNKNLWISTLGNGMYKLNLLTNKVIHFTGEKDHDFGNTTDSLINRFINSILISSDEKLYIGTVIGLGCLDLKSNSFVTAFGVNQLLEGQAINTLYEDHLGMIWIGTSEGVFKFNPLTNKFKSFSIEDGLPSNSISSITEDSIHNIWISTNYGISKMDVESGTFTNYYTQDGLQGNEFAARSYSIDKDHRIYFGGFHGITHFDPLEIKDEVKKLDIFITGLYINDLAVNAGMKSGPYEIINTPLIEANKINLYQKDNSFTIEFSAMDYSNPERIQYMYKMGEDTDWIMLRSGTNNITFNDLSPDTYNFMVRAKNYNTYSDDKKITIIIHPVWYFTNAAKVIYILILGLIITYITQEIRQKRRTRKQMQEHIHAEQINEEKLQYFINIAHEIRTPLSLIINPLKKLIEKDNDPETQKSYITINRNSERILHLVNQLMDIQKIDKGQMELNFVETDIIKYIENLCGIFHEQFKMKNIDFKILHDLNKSYVWIDPRNFDKVIINVLSNAIKFTPENGKIHVKINSLHVENNDKEHQKFIQIAISDSGIGLPENELERVFDYFYQVKDGMHKSFDGTGIGLHLSRSIVNLHHGKILAKNNSNNEGCSFVIQLPLGNKHIKDGEIKLDTTSEKKSPEPVNIPSLIKQENEGIKSRSKTRILVVDDDEEILEYIYQEMAKDYHVKLCTNGKEALSHVLKNNPDLIISDVLMPEMDGITFCRKIKQNVNINHIPVILLTARSKEEDNIKGLDIGADAYLTKPFNIEILKKTVHNIIKNRQILKNNFGGGQKQTDKVRTVTMKSPDEKILLKAIEIVNENIGDPALNVEMLAKEIGISRVHLHRKMKALTNQSTRDFIRNIRLQQAANILSTKHMNISEVAYTVGFSNVAHFSNAFKELFGESPSAYMEAQLKES